MIRRLAFLVLLLISPRPENTNQYTVFITDTGTKYHVETCQYLSQSKIEISVEDACNSGYTPCSVCNPPNCAFAAVDPISEQQPQKFSLSQNYPNPFNASTTFTVWIDRPQEARLDVFDLSGRMVMTAFSGSLPAGENRIVVDAGGLPSGAYLAVLSGESQRITRKIVSLK